ncbi:MAG: hypothetical protein RIR00_2340, partial [Pseudomonadota bacterium]
MSDLLLDLSAPSSLGATHGYAFSGDQVSLHAELQFNPRDAAAGEHWCLQLWASLDGFAQGLNGIKVAETPLLPQPGFAPIHAQCAATPPAGRQAWHLALALVSFAADGSIRIHDLAAYPETATFAAPHFHGELQARVEGEQLALQIAGIHNPRSPDNLSGSLAIELWATPGGYQGGAWSGEWLAGCEIGTLAGGEQQDALQLQLPLPDGQPALTLMLREWTPQGYVTRDYQTLALPETASVPVAATAAAPASAPAAEIAPAPAPAEVSAPAPEPASAPASSPVAAV